MTVTCTYDHRVIQGAESGLFLGRLQSLLEGEDGFYDAIFLRPRHSDACDALGAGPIRCAGDQCRSNEAGCGRAPDSGMA